METKSCPACRGLRLKESSLAVLLNGLSIAEISAFTVAEALDHFCRIELTPREGQIAGQVLKEIVERLQFLNQCRAAVPYSGPAFGNSLRRGGATDSPGYPDWFRPDRGDLYPR